MLSFLRDSYGRALAPLARLLLRVGLSPSAVTVLGTLGVVASSLLLLGSGRFVAGFVAIAVFLLGDGLDGTMARLSGRESRFGAFLDSTLDRVADAAVFAGLAFWAAGRDPWVLGLAVAALAAGFLVSYARARAEAEGWDASVGLFERTDRLVVTMTAVLLAGLGVGTALPIGLAVVVAGAAVTVGQRVRAAWLASRVPPPPGRGRPAP